MEYLIMLVVGALSFGFYQLKKRNEAEVDSKLAETKGKDSILSRGQNEIEQEVNKIDERLKLITEERKKQLQAEDNKTLEEKALEANKKFGN